MRKIEKEYEENSKVGKKRSSASVEQPKTKR